MTKKAIIIVGSSIIVILIILNIYIYISCSNISKYTNESNTHSQNIVLIDKFRTDINKMAQAQKIYLVTLKDEYKVQYEKNLKDIYSTLSNMESSGVITYEEEDELKKVVYDYSISSEEYMNSSNKEVVSEELEKQIIDSNNSQINILTKLDKYVEITNSNLNDNNTTISDSATQQKNRVQSISTVITGLVSSIFYFIKKNGFKVNKDVEKIINCIDNKEVVDNINTKVNTVSGEIVRCEYILQQIKIIYKHSNKMKDKLNKYQEVIAQIDSYLNQLRLKIQESEVCSPGVKSEILREVEQELVELKLLLESLTIHNGIIVEISSEIINDKNKI
ncbi:MAG: hypothetical protein RRZ84_01195 [Romboutsia sp.]